MGRCECGPESRPSQPIIVDAMVDRDFRLDAVDGETIRDFSSGGVPFGGLIGRLDPMLSGAVYHRCRDATECIVSYSVGGGDLLRVVSGGIVGSIVGIATMVVAWQTHRHARTKITAARDDGDVAVSSNQLGIYSIDHRNRHQLVFFSGTVVAAIGVVAQNVIFVGCLVGVCDNLVGATTLGLARA